MCMGKHVRLCWCSESVCVFFCGLCMCWMCFAIQWVNVAAMYPSFSLCFALRFLRSASWHLYVYIALGGNVNVNVNVTVYGLKWMWNSVECSSLCCFMWLWQSYACVCVCRLPVVRVSVCLCAWVSIEWMYDSTVWWMNQHSHTHTHRNRSFIIKSSDCLSWIYLCRWNVHVHVYSHYTYVK